MQPEQHTDDSQPCPRPETPSRPQTDNNDINSVEEKLKTEYLLSECGSCTLKPGEQHGWKPPTMKAPVLVSFAIFSVLIILCLEFLAQRSQQKGGLSLVDDAKELSGLVTFGYLYLPLIVAGVYSLLWNWIDLDVKRIQPWLELSKPSGARGDDSLFLDYPVDFVGFVPFKSSKRRHWPVFFSGTIMVLIFWVITPLQSSVFGTKSVLIHQEVPTSTPLQFMDPLAQAAVLSQATLNAAFAITWLDQPYPAFTTSDHMLLPFYPAKPVQGKVANWTGVTTKYWTELHCWPASTTTVPPRLHTNIHFDNGKGCYTSEIDVNSQAGGENILYVGWWDSAYADISLEGPTCGPAAANQFLAIWSHNFNDTKINITAAFCETSYYKQKVRALVRADGLVPVDGQIDPLGPIEPLPITEFNSSAFEYLLGNGMSSVDMPRDFPFTELLDQVPKLKGRDIPHPLWSPMVGFALGMTNATVHDFSDANLMQSVFQSVHRRIFSSAFPTLLKNSTDSGDVLGEAHIVKYGVVVSRLFFALVESILGIVTILMLLLLWCCHRSPSMLSEDPGSLGHLFSVIQDSSLLLKGLRGTGTLTAEELQEKLGDCRYKLVCGCRDISGQRTLRLVGGDRKSIAGLATLGIRARFRAEALDHYSPMKPLALRQLVGFFFCLILCVAIAVLSFFWYEDKTLGGLALPSSNYEVNKILTSYCPTIFSTLVEPFWVVLNRMLCLLQPFYDLLSDRGTAQRTINAKYTALPPQLALWRAFKSGHFLLGLLCLTTLLGNVLSVGLGALFDQRPLAKSYPWEMSRQTQFSRNELVNFSASYSTVNDRFYTIIANMSYGTPLPPWMNEEFSFLPVNLSSNVFSEGSVFSAQTVGFGVEPSCKSLGWFSTKNAPPSLDPSLADDHGNFTSCNRNYQLSTMTFNNSNYLTPSGMSASEAATTFAQWGVPNGACGQVILFGWARSNLSRLVDDPGNQTQGSLLAEGDVNSSFVICSPIPKIADFHIEFDYQGHILNATPLNDASSSAQYASLAPALETLVGTLNNQLPGYDMWHNNSVSQDTFSYLLGLDKGTSSIYDPSAPTPDPEWLLPSIVKVYKLTWATAFNDIQASLENRTQEVILGAHTVLETRVFMSWPAFAVSITILIIYLLMTLVFFGWGIIFFLPRMPTTIGSQLAYIATSSLANASYKPKSLVEGKTFRYGRLIGPDGRAYIGIDSSDRVVPLDPVALVKGETRRKRLSLFGFNLRFPGRKHGQGQDVLI